MENILEEIKQERNYQNENWGNEFDDKNTLNDWVAYITAYASKASFMTEKDMVRKSLLKTAALAVAAIESYDRNSGFAPRHYDAS